LTGEVGNAKELKKPVWGGGEEIYESKNTIKVLRAYPSRKGRIDRIQKEKKSTGEKKEIAGRDGPAARERLRVQRKQPKKETHRN